MAIDQLNSEFLAANCVCEKFNQRMQQQDILKKGKSRGPPIRKRKAAAEPAQEQPRAQQTPRVVLDPFRDAFDSVDETLAHTDTRGTGEEEELDI